MDAATLLTANALLSSAAALVMGVVLRTRRTYPGFGFWTCGIACLALGTALLIPDVLPPGWAARVARNGLLLAGHALILRGMLVFRGLRVGAWLEAVLALLFLGSFGWLSLDAARLSDRIVCYCLFSCTLSLATVAVTLRRRPPHFGSNDLLLALWLTLFALITLVRAGQELGDVSTAFEAIKGFGGIYALAQILSVQLVTLTLISMNSQRIEWELGGSEQQLRSMGDNLPAGFIYRYELIDGRRRFDHVSSGVEGTLGLRAAEVMVDAGPLFALLTPEARERYLADEARSAAGLSDFHATLCFQLADGRLRWLDVRSRPQRRPDGATFWDGVAMDVTERLQAQQALAEHRRQLEDTVERRTRQLAEASRRAEAANLAKSAFLANMSHEIRTPLNAMIGMAHLIRREDLSVRQLDRLSKLETAARHLLEVLNAVLDLSKIEAGKMVLEALPLRVETTVADVMSMVEERAEARHLQLASAVDPMPRDLVGDPTRLQQALLNYANNAVKFTESGSVTIRVRLLEQDEHGVLLRFEVQDTGIGVAADDLPRLFEAFEQADRSTTRSAGGTGLGLAITRRLAELMGGDAGATSEPGAGSTFWFTARLRRDPSAHATLLQGPSADAEQTLRRRHAGARVLLAEDNPVNAEVAQALLDEVGLVVDVASDGICAVDMALQHDYRLVLMDMQMPGLDGLDACRAIRQQRPSAGLPIIAMTANAFAEDKARCRAAGMDDFISKPVDPGTLYRLLLKWMDKRG
ncbi:hybrid sensor histidine kinase/response regulator [Rubrivivax gelatinosus]|uniref:Virulence sensor protein BvgS n=1 Tax=Rubrivivax gelatinosus TaxID=28068 RepID=A0A4R2LXH1_RUBGE|nr:ATP-binding protein [Rubrivivax gelatinosus]MBK1688023.1 hybrid sensor histidine kinase/response regulator [Rubrivivax gelatinosus]TCO99308.1 PAS domain S-box-containing protein [Rubrivivax gelatinosus]